MSRSAARSPVPGSRWRNCNTMTAPLKLSTRESRAEPDQRDRGSDNAGADGHGGLEQVVTDGRPGAQWRAPPESRPVLGFQRGGSAVEGTGRLARAGLL